MKKDTKYRYVRKTTTWQGKRYEVTGRTEMEALEKLAELKAKLRNNDATIGPDVTVDRWFQEWMALYKEPAGLTGKSLGMYREKYKNYIGPAVGKMKMREVREVNLQRLLNTQAGRSYSHVSKLRLVLREMFSRAASTRMIPFDPTTKLELPETTKGQRRSLTDREREAFLAVAQTHRAGLFMLTILYAGLRPGEVAALNWEDIDFDRREIIVHKAVESGTDRKIKATKTNAGMREIPMNSVLLDRMQKVRGKQGTPVFTVSTGKRVDHQAIRRMWNSFLRDVDIEMGAVVYRNQIIQSVVAPDLTMYCLRHTFCTDLQRAGVPINIAKELMGHSDIAVTANIYTHKDQDTLRRYIDATEAQKEIVTSSAHRDDLQAFNISDSPNFALPARPKFSTHSHGANMPPVENGVENVN